MKGVCVNALLSNKQSERISGQEKLDRYKLAMRIDASKGEMVLSVEQISKIKNQISEFYPTIISGQAWMLLEQEDTKKRKKEKE